MTTNNRWLTAQRSLAHKDAVLGDIIRRVGPCALTPKRSAFAALVETIVHQQLSLKAGQTIYNRVRRLCPTGRISIDSLKQVTDFQLRSAGLSRAKVVYVTDLIDRIGDRTMNLRKLADLDDEQIIENLTVVKGIGRWSAQMYLIFVLNRPDIFSPADVGLQIGIEKLYRITGNSAKLELFAERWRPYRSVACWYLWQSRNLSDSA
ncbi:MAG: DNA-3-methyladenine glycosylase family protein [Candidatus Zixiibacteriota bacterium]